MMPFISMKIQSLYNSGTENVEYFLLQDEKYSPFETGSGFIAKPWTVMIEHRSGYVAVEKGNGTSWTRRGLEFWI